MSGSIRIYIRSGTFILYSARKVNLPRMWTIFQTRSGLVCLYPASRSPRPGPSPVSPRYLWIGGESEWETSGEELMVRTWQGVEKWPFIGLECEGRGIWYQVCWYGDSGLEVVNFWRIPSYSPVLTLCICCSCNP